MIGPKVDQAIEGLRRLWFACAPRAAARFFGSAPVKRNGKKDRRDRARHRRNPWVYAGAGRRCTIAGTPVKPVYRSINWPRWLKFLAASPNKRLHLPVPLDVDGRANEGRPLAMNRLLAKVRVVTTKKLARERPLRPDDVVEVKSAAEILATLDSDASIDAMPFMPEMLEFAGKRLTVSHRVEKICDTVSGGPPISRRMRDTVFLEDLRCDGSRHGGCQAGCRIYWKESWLRRVDSRDEPTTADGDELTPLEHRDLRDRLETLASDGARAIREGDGTRVESYRCQATEALRATEPLSGYDPRQYIRELTSGNVGLRRFVHVAVRALSGPIRRRLRLLSYRPLRPSGVAALIHRRLRLPGYKPPAQNGVAVPARGELNLRPGETVRVRSAQEIAGTVDESGKNRGLSFDWEMIPYCGGRYRVQDRVERIIDEHTGQMIALPSDCLILDGVVCSGDHSRGRWFCPRAIYPYWREAWLSRVEDGTA
jgi:hypothetical protein